jgi:S1-C subfamily serine protease
MAPIGQEAEVVVWRDRHELTRAVTMADRDATLALTRPRRRPSGPGARSLLRRPPRPDPAAGPDSPATTPGLGLDLVTLNAATARKLGLPETLRGVAVAEVDPSSPLAPYFQPLDVISTAGGQPIRTAEEAARLLDGRPGRGPLELGRAAAGRRGDARRDDPHPRL